MSSGGMSRVPMAAWNVRRSLDRTRTVLRMFLIMFVGSAVGGTGRGILPLGPSTTPSRRPMTGMSGASATKKPKSRARPWALRLFPAYSSISCGWITRSATGRTFVASSPEAKTQIRTGLPRPLGRRTSSSMRFLGTDRSTSRRFSATSTVSLNCRDFADSKAFLTVSTECFSAKGMRLLQSERRRGVSCSGRPTKEPTLIKVLRGRPPK